jgi:hypothetical protein
MWGGGAGLARERFQENPPPRLTQAFWPDVTAFKTRGSAQVVLDGVEDHAAGQKHTDTGHA